MNAALFIGIETFADPEIHPVKYAVNDANAVASAFEKLGFPKDNGGQVILLNEKATKTRVEYEIGRLLKGAREEDSILIFFSAHGASEGGISYLVCHDTFLRGMATTGITIKSFFEMVETTKSRKVMLLLDFCHAGLQFPRDGKGIMGGMTDDEIKAFSEKANYCVAFASCAASEKSRWSDKNRLGIWTSALLEALTGKTKQILKNNRFLLAINLQNYLFQQVPKRRWEEYKDKEPQTPQLYGSLSNEFIVADLEPVLDAQVQGIGDLSSFLNGISFRAYRTDSIRNLPGFSKKRRHTVPETKNAATEDFVADIAEERVQEQARWLFDALVKEFGYTRDQIKLDAYKASALITTKDFEVDIQISQSNDDPTKFEEVQFVNKFKTDAVMMSEAFNKVFHREVTTLRVEFTPSRKVSEVIDQIQKATDSKIQIKSYEPDASACCITVGKIEGRIFLRANRTSISLSGQPRQMIQALTAARKEAFLDTASVMLLPAHSVTTGT